MAKLQATQAKSEATDQGPKPREVSWNYAAMPKRDPQDVQTAQMQKDAGHPLSTMDKWLLELPLYRWQQRQIDKLIAQAKQGRGEPLNGRERELLGLPPTANDREDVKVEPTLADKITSGDKLSTWQGKIAAMAAELKIPLRVARKQVYIGKINL